MTKAMLVYQHWGPAEQEISVVWYSKKTGRYLGIRDTLTGSEQTFWFDKDGETHGSIGFPAKVLMTFTPLELNDDEWD